MIVRDTLADELREIIDEYDEVTESATLKVTDVEAVMGSDVLSVWGSMRVFDVRDEEYVTE